jgi:hypothetical protein
MKNNGSTICFVIAAVFMLIGIQNIWNASGSRSFDSLVGYGVGSMLPTIGLLIAGLILKRKENARSSPTDAEIVETPPPKSS